MILLSETDEFKFFAIEVPKDCPKVEKVDKEGMPICLMVFNKNLSAYPVRVDEDFELLGVIGGNVADQNSIEKGHYYNLLVSLLAEKGILVENPIEKPELCRYCDGYGYIGGLEIPCRVCNVEGSWRCSDPVKSIKNKSADWKSYESRLVKAVILKVKK